jgi:pimeloyl-ACP methyl ester carboxylesterase
MIQKKYLLFPWHYLHSLLLSFGSIPQKTIEKKYMNKDSKFIKVRGMNIHYRDQGQGPAIVLLHGMLASLHTWDGWVDKLTKNYRVVRIDMPGFGLTGPAPENFDYEVDTVIALLDEIFTELKLTKFTLAGNSLGGYNSWNYAIKYPNKIEKLILIDPAGYPQKVPGPITLLTAPILGSISAVFTPKFIFTYFIKQVYGDPKRISQETSDRYYEVNMREGNRGASKKILTVMNKRAKEQNLGDGIATLNKLQIPTMVMWGELDTWVPISLMERWKKDLPNARFVIFNGASHVPMEEIPEQTVTEAITFMEQKTTQTTANAFI